LCEGVLLGYSRVYRLRDGWKALDQDKLHIGTFPGTPEGEVGLETGRRAAAFVRSGTVRALLASLCVVFRPCSRHRKLQPIETWRRSAAVKTATVC